MPGTSLSAGNAEENLRKRKVGSCFFVHWVWEYLFHGGYIENAIQWQVFATFWGIRSPAPLLLLLRNGYSESFVTGFCDK